jgi:hypothetical protein
MGKYEKNKRKYFINRSLPSKASSIVLKDNYCEITIINIFQMDISARTGNNQNFLQ